MALAMRMSAVMIGFIGVMLAGALTLVWLNRASPVVMNAAVPVAVGALSALGLVFAFTKPEPISRTFSVVFVVENASRLPISIPHRPFPWLSIALADQMRQIDATTFEPPKGQEEGFDFIAPLYHEFLQKVMIDNLAAKQFGTWRTRTERFGGSGFEQFGPMPDAGNYPSKVLSVEELQKALGKNRFARVHSHFGKWALHPGTELHVEAPHSDPQAGEVGTIRLKNRFCEISIRTVRSMWGVGLGSYALTLGASQEDAQKQYRTLHYIARIRATFPWYLMGHPDMAVHREWANGIVEELTYAFDEEGLWRRTTEAFMLWQHLPPVSRGIPLPLGPIRSSGGQRETSPSTRE